jgi:hypothetical protein
VANEIDFEKYFEEKINSLKEFINEKFKNMETQTQTIIKNIEKDVGHAHEKIRNQENRMKIIETHISLFKDKDKEKISAWKKIQESFWGWLVPFVLLAVLYALSKGYLK